MKIDKSWIHIKNRLSQEYWKGLQGFIDYAKDFVNEEGKISCPCKRCVNGEIFPPKDVRRHIFECGFDVTYAHWVFDGEPPELPSLPKSNAKCYPEDERAAILDDIVGETREHDLGGVTTNNMGDEVHSQYEDMPSELHAYFYPGCTKDDPLAGEQYSAFENRKDQCLTLGRTKEAHNKYTQMSEESQTPLGQVCSSSSTNEFEIMNRKLKKHRKCQSGIDPTLSKDVGAARCVEDGATSALQDHRDARIIELQPLR
ncbi:unnamed protein product [Cuscuta epithymum]|uniref:Transposase-associated domain-containing protein n=1 Tax=Cuscuta epithymum TaxID=186058 RepID=A0AAV0FUP4_9ASTE|nr:unnamed protein product [Cuscuta epithymum]